MATLKLVIFIQSIVICLSTSEVADREFNLVSEPVTICDSVSSEVVNATGVSSEIDCVTKCLAIGCSVAVAHESCGLCQMALVYEDHSAGSQVQRLLGSESGARVWKADSPRVEYLNLNISFEFQTTSTGQTGTVQQLLINTTGCYRIEAAGASGSPGTTKPSGRGALIAGNFSLLAGTQLSIVVGQQGGTASESYGGGGGGGSFVYSYNATGSPQLLLAAGGGGGGCYTTAGANGTAGVNGTNSVAGSPSYYGYGGANGQPGYNNPSGKKANTFNGGCGAGWLGKAVNTRASTYDGDRGGSLVDNWVGGVAPSNYGAGVGGFGGGGGGSSGVETTLNDGGGGGGFSGGGAGIAGDHGGGGGGSFCGGTGCVGVTGGNNGSYKGFVKVRAILKCN